LQRLSVDPEIAGAVPAAGGKPIPGRRRHAPTGAESSIAKAVVEAETESGETGKNAPAEDGVAAALPILSL
jgi:hypothetical protein